MTKVEALIKLAFEPKLLKALLSLRYKEYLIDIGWINSFKQKSPLDKNNNPIPWLTYPFIDFIDKRLNKNIVIFEFGSGSSTYYYAKKVKKVITIEHNKEWFEKVKKNLPPNVELFLKELSPTGEYSKSVKSSEENFDIIFIDGEERNECIKNSLTKLKENGVLVLDDSEREDYKAGIEYLASNSFKRIDFWGISPGYFNLKATTVFYRQQNCLGI